MKNNTEPDAGRKPSASFVIGAIALVFLIIGYQIALFVHEAAVTRIVANHDRPDTVFVVREEMSGSARHDSATARHDDASARNDSGRARQGGEAEGQDAGSEWRGPEGERVRVYRKSAEHSPAAERIRLRHTPRRYENFRFDPNTVSVEDLMRLGFSQRQALSIDNYRQKGGRFRRKADFAKSYVVADSVYKRLEPYIHIPKIDLNAADSATFETLPGIGKFFAARMVSYRKELGGYSYPEQLMDIWHFDREKYDALQDLITVGPAAPYPLWTLPEEALRKHPYIGKYAARGIVLYREHNPRSAWTVEALGAAGILPPDKAEKLARCRLAAPDEE